MKASGFAYIALCVLLLICPASVGFSGDELNFGDRIPTQNEIIEGLSTVKTPKLPEGSRVRSIRPVKQVSKSVSIEIRFKKKSYELSPRAEQKLAVFGDALKTEQLQDAKIVIEGHTCASGTDEYNQRLSEKRAQAVKNYLANIAGVDPKRLKTIGKGETEPLLEDRPYAAENRRVRFVRND